MRKRKIVNHYRHLCPICDKWHSRLEGCRENDINNARLQRWLRSDPRHDESIFFINSGGSIDWPFDHQGEKGNG
jgi:hypothetical protein